MEKFSSGLLAAMLALGLPPGPCLSGDMVITERAVRTASARMYSDILRYACLNGRRYPVKYIRNGFKRHYEEMRLRLLGDGVTIIATTMIQPNLPHMIGPLSQMDFDAERRLALPPQFGCFRAYWRDDELQF